MININISGLIFTTADEQIVQIDVNLDVVKAIIAISEVSLVVFFFLFEFLHHWRANIWI